MDALQKKELLHLRIEQANERMLDALTEMAETLFRTWQPEVMQEQGEWTEERMLEMPAPGWARPLTEDELAERLERASEEIERGEFVELDELEKEVSSW